MADFEPLAVILVTSGTRGDRLLFRYPFEAETDKVSSKSSGRNPFAVKVVEDFQANKCSLTASISNGSLAGFSNTILASLLTAKVSLCGRNFDVKINDVRFVGYPVQLQTESGKSTHQILSFSIVFALKATVKGSVISCFHDLSKQLTVAIRHEENRCHYLSTQGKIMTAVHDQIQSSSQESVESPFKLILQKSQLAKDLKTVFDSLLDSGIVHLYLNHWLEISFCLPHKINVIPGGTRVLRIEPEIIQRCLESLRPYHGMLLLVEEQGLLDSLPVDCTPTLSRLIQVASPLRNFQRLALEADLSLSQVFKLVCHLVYWAKATVIYPLCETNVYILSPQANTLVNSSLVETFVTKFPGKSLPVELSEFSFPIQLRENRDFLEHPRQQDQKVRIVVWMLQHRLLMQLHTYVFLVPPVPRRKKKMSEELKMTGSMLMPIVLEEGTIIESITELTRVSSFSDVASVNSDESVGVGPVPMYINQFSKSPSSEIASDSSVVSEDPKSTWPMPDVWLSNLSRDERECIMNVSAAKNPDDLKLFARLCPYFNGKHHLEEIMYYENLPRSQLLSILDKFRDVLIMCQHQDPATTFYAR